MAFQLPEDDTDDKDIEADDVSSRDAETCLSGDDYLDAIDEGTDSFKRQLGFDDNFGDTFSVRTDYSESYNVLIKQLGSRFHPPAALPQCGQQGGHLSRQKIQLLPQGEQKESEGHYQELDPPSAAHGDPKCSRQSGNLMNTLLAKSSDITWLQIALSCAASMSVAICVYIIFRISVEKSPIMPCHIRVRVPCQDLTEFFPVTSVHQYTDAITNQRFKDADIQRVKDKNATSCELPIGSLLTRMTRNDNLVKGQVFMKAGETGPSLEFSKYTLSIYKDQMLTNIETDRYSIMIPADGMYFLYFGASLSYGTPVMCKDLEFKTSISHLLRQQSPLERHPAVLMGAEHTCCETCEKEKHTEFTGGLFHLNKDDRLFLQVSSPDLVARDEGTFLGIIQLSSIN